MGFMEGSRAGSQADVAAVMDAKGVDQLWELVALGALVSVGTTKDAGAVAVTVTIDGEWEREYVRDGEQLDLWLSELVPQAKDLLAEVAASRVQKPRTRRRITG